MRRMTIPMRAVLQNLLDGVPVDTSFGYRALQAPTAIPILRKRGYVATGETGLEITPSGREALVEAKGKN